MVSLIQLVEGSLWLRMGWLILESDIVLFDHANFIIGELSSTSSAMVSLGCISVGRLLKVGALAFGWWVVQFVVFLLAHSSACLSWVFSSSASSLFASSQESHLHLQWQWIEGVLACF